MKNRVKLSTIVKNQLPAFVRNDYPLLGEFLTEYYKSQEYVGSPTDLLSNIDQYLKLDEISKSYKPQFYDNNDVNIAKITGLTVALSSSENVITVKSTKGFPDSYGLIKINDEIITYASKNDNQFIDCIRGLSAIDSWRDNGELIFKDTLAEDHVINSEVTNLSAQFLDIFLTKIKKQLIPGFNPNLDIDIDQNLFIKHAKDFYRTKGTDISFKILFRALYGEEVKIIKPSDYLIKPSNSFNKITKNVVVESIEGDPLKLVNRTLRQDPYLGQNSSTPNYGIQESYGTVSYVEKIFLEGKEYYNISLDFGYSRDIPVDGTIYGNFVSHPKTKLIGNILLDEKNPTIDVDSTLGFPNEGRLVINGYRFDYSGKSSNQFYNINALDFLNFTIDDNTDVYLDVYAYGETIPGQKDIKVRITPVINKLNILDDTFYMSEDDTIKIKSLGFYSKSKKANSWIFNHSVTYNSDPISSGGNTLSTTEKNNFRIGDKLIITDNEGISVEKEIDEIFNERFFSITPPIVNDGRTKYYKIKRKLLKNKSTENFEDLSSYTTDIQNTYVKSYNNDVLVLSNSIPYFYNKTVSTDRRKVSFYGIFGNPVSLSGFYDLKITDGFIDHGFYTGDAIYYSYAINGGIVDETNTLKSELTGLNLLEGVYYVQRIDRNTIRLANSLADLYRKKWISIYGNIPETSKNIIEYYPFYQKSLKPQNILREIKLPIEDDKNHETIPGSTGIFVNGVELLNYKSTDSIYYGKIDNIQITSPGKNYDIINPPLVVINDTDGMGSGASCIPSVIGSLERIDIIDPGFDYIDEPIVQISGGNGFGAKVKPKMKIVPHIVEFNARLGVKTDIDAIEFPTYHKLKTGDRVIYRTDDLSNISGLSTDSEYYISILDYKNIKLHQSKSDAITGINTINLISVGQGIQKFETYEKKKILSELTIENPGFGYQNKKRIVASSGINTFSDTLVITNHGYENKEIVVYNTTGSPIEGLINNQSYIVSKIDENSFKLSKIGVGVTFLDYDNKEYINLSGFGTGVHSFNYEPIKVSIIGSLKSSPVIGTSFEAKIQPVFRGSINSLSITSSGVSYGSTEILNYKRSPVIEFNSGKDAKVLPIINDGRIKEVLIINQGSGYNSIPDLLIEGSGRFAKLTPIVENGNLIEIKVIDGGIGYTSSDTRITILSAGSGCKAETNIQKWTVNLFAKNYSFILPDGDDGFLTNSINSSYELEYSNLYTPRVLRESIYSQDSDGNTLYGIKDLVKSSGVEIDSNKHSPIVGWAYDGNPIYGPYGYKNIDGSGDIVQMVSGYDLVLKSNRPPGFELGFFVEDFEFIRPNSTLDEHNGRFCQTPDFPNGIYAYFTTLSLEPPSNSGPFRNYKAPEFPYVIGNSFRSLPNKFNFDKNSNANDYDLNKTDWFRNTTPYNLNSNYEYIFNPNNVRSSNSDIKYAKKGKVENIQILYGGKDYKVDDTIIFERANEITSECITKVSKISGRDVGIISSYIKEINNVELFPISEKEYIAFCSSNHDLNTNNLIKLSNLNKVSKNLENTFKISVPNNILSLTTGIGSTALTGLVTYLNVNGNLNYPNILENDILEIGTEKIKVLNVDKDSSRIRVLRSYGNTVGLSYSSSQRINETSRKFYFNCPINKELTHKQNREYYIIPSESLGIGTSYGVGIGYNLNFSNPGIGITQLIIPTKSIYIQNHNLSTGDELIYNYENGSPIQVSFTGIGVSSLAKNQKLYALRISDNLIGICTSKNQLSINNSLYFVNSGSGVIHSFKTNYENSLNSKLERNICLVSLASTLTNHNLSLGDKVFFDIISKREKTIKIKYNDELRRMVVNPIGFTTSSVDIDNNTIFLPNHGYYNGEKVVHTSLSPCNGLENNKIYYVNVKGKDVISLSNFYYETVGNNIKEVNIISASFGEISQINPKIEVIKNETIIFDLTDESLSDTYSSTKYSAFDFNIYSDVNFAKVFYGSGNEKDFEVEKFGKIGISSTSYLKLKISENIPDILYYSLKPSSSRFVSPIKKQLYIDSESINHNKIVVTSSKFSGEKEITGIGSYYFEYDLNDYPEFTSYSQLNSDITYSTSSKTEYGSVRDILVVNSSDKYQTVPGISTIITQNGKNLLLEASSKSIGKAVSTKILDIGFDYPTDNTIRPFTVLPNTLKVIPLSSFDEIFVTYPGRNYTQDPDLVVIDTFTNQIVKDVILDYTLRSPKVKILQNSSGFYGIEPKIIPINNTNGVGISSISYNQSTKDVTVSLGSSFSTGYFPFAVGDNVLIENISISDIGKGYNSKDYGYKLFKITEINPFFGGFGGAYVKFNLKNYLSPNENPGTFDTRNTYGRIISERDFPQFKSTLTKNNFIIGEEVESNGIFGTVEKWNDRTEFLKVSSDEVFDEGVILIGKTSKTRGFIQKVFNFNCEYEIDSFSVVNYGTLDESGFLNNSLQRISNNYYYQQFSYSLNSKVSIDQWSNEVDNLNHTSGFLKFSDYIIESIPQQNQTSNLIVQAAQTSVDVVNDIINVIDLEDVPNFDVVTENKLLINGINNSNEIVFNTKELVDYFESVGNRVLTIDDISPQFYSDPRPTPFSAVDTFNLDFVAKKYFIHIKDKTFFDERQLLIVTLLHDGMNGFINQYGRVETQDDMGYFDFRIFGSQGQLVFYPTKYKVNDYNLNLVSYDMKKNLTLMGNDYNLGNIVNVSSHKKSSFNSPTTIVGLSSNSVRASKLLVFLSDQHDRRQFNEITLIHDDNESDFIEYGQITDGTYSPIGEIGLGTYKSSLSGNNLNLDFYPNSGLEVSSNVIAVSIGKSNTAISGVGYLDDGSILGSSYANIPSSTSSYETVIASYPSSFESAYFIVCIEDLTNNDYQVSEVVVVNDSANDPLISEYGILITNSTLGEIGCRRLSNNIELTFSQNPNAEMQVRVFRNAFKLIQTSQSPNLDAIDLTDSQIKVYSGSYEGTDSSVRTSFNLNHKGLGIFGRSFSGIDTSVIDIQNSTLKFSNHYFVTGEKVVYNHEEFTSSAIGIATTSIPGYGMIDYLPKESYVIKLNDNLIQLAATAEDALKIDPIPLQFRTLGIGTLHSINSYDPNSRVMITIDNIIQSPIAGSAITCSLIDNLVPQTNRLITSGLTSFFGNDLIRIGNEIMKVDTVGFGTVNGLLVKRAQMGTVAAAHSTGDLIRKLTGSYNIVNNTIHFPEAPKGLIPSVSTNNLNPIFTFNYNSITGLTTVVTVNDHYYLTNDEIVVGGAIVDAFNGYYKISFSDNIKTFNINLPPGIVGIASGNLYTYKPNKGVSVNERDWTGISTSSKFHGRSFIRSAQLNTTNHTYENNYVFDDISHGFNSLERLFTLKSNNVNTIGFSTYSSSILVNNIFQTPQGSLNSVQSYELIENAGITSIRFVGAATSAVYDPNTSSIPVGGVIVSVGSSQGFGYQPLVSAGGTAIVSAAGTIQSISIGNSGSGYRSGIQTNVYVSVTNNNANSGISTISIIGIASITNGHISSVKITKSIGGYASTNPPLVFIDEPLPYYNIPLQYSLSSSGSGMQATADIIVSQDSSISNFNIRYAGYSYNVGDTLTIPTGGLIGIPTDTSKSFKEFQLYVDKTYNHSFNGWTFGQLLVLDDISDLFNGQRTLFPLKVNNEVISIRSKPGSNIDIASTLLVFVNDVLQIPGQGYIFNGGSRIRFTEPPKGLANEIPGTNDSCKILFYKGSGEIDVIFRDILETIKVGDEVQILKNAATCENSVDEENRTIYDVGSTDFVETNLYNGPGINDSLNCLRTITWKRQREDLIINGAIVGKNRIIYEPIINPLTYPIQPISIGSTRIYVENVKTFFDSKKEDLDPDFRKKITIVSQDECEVGFVTSHISTAGIVTGVSILNPGKGYDFVPKIVFESPVGLSNTYRATGIVSIQSGSISNVLIINPGFGYTTTPNILIEYPKIKKEETGVSTYKGDFGYVVGVRTSTSIGIANTVLTFDLFIPPNSPLKDEKVVGIDMVKNYSSLSINDYFVVKNTFIGNGVTSLYNDNSILGVGNSYLNNVYQVIGISTLTTSVPGFGTTSITRVSVSLQNYNGITGIATTSILGEYSWGIIELETRKNPKQFNSYFANGLSGLSTSSIVKRTYRLKYTDYLP